MRRIICLILAVIMLLAILTSCFDNSNNIFINGSASVERVISMLIEAFNQEHPDIILTFSPTGSGAGINSVIEGMADIGISSRELRENETGVDATTFAIDGLAIIIHPDNPVYDLTTEQIAGIYTGAVTNWSQVGGLDSPISVIGREAGSGSRGAFEDIMDITDETTHDQELNSGGAIVAAVSTNRFAIGYTSLSTVNDDVKTISVNGVAVSEATLLDETYPIARPFIMMTQSGGEISEAVQKFMEFIMSAAATDIISKAGVLQAR